jgi:drug/metabolite transporter (DMT)-like permease
MQKENRGYAYIIAAQFLVGFVYILVKLGDAFGVYNLAFFRVFLSFVVIGALFIFSKRYKISPIKKEKVKLIFFGIMHGLIILASYISIKYLSIAMAVILSSTISIWMMIFSHYILKEKITKTTIWALIISFAGLMIIVASSEIFTKTTFIGIIAGLFVGAAGGLVYTLSKTFKTYDKVSLTFWQNLIATPLLIPLLFIKTPIFTWYNSLIVASMGIVGALSFIFLFVGFGLVKGQKASILNLLNPVFTIWFGIIILFEIPTIKEIIGGILIIIGSYIVTKS